MAINTSSTLAVDMQTYFNRRLLENSPRTGKYIAKQEFSTITYTSLRGWMFLNYTLLMLLMSLPITISYWIYSLIR